MATAETEAGFAQNPTVTEFRMTINSFAIEMPMTMDSFALGWQADFKALGAGLYTQPMLHFNDQWKPSGFSFAVGSEFDLSQYIFQIELGVKKPTWTNLKDWKMVPKVSLLFSLDKLFAEESSA